METAYSVNNSVLKGACGVEGMIVPDRAKADVPLDMLHLQQVRWQGQQALAPGIHTTV